jgi:hypothetical protein
MDKEIQMFKLSKDSLPLKVEPYHSCEGNNGFAIFTADKNERVVFDCGSYGYDTLFFEREEAVQNALFLNKLFKKIK